MAKRRFELVAGTSNKFWEIEVTGASFTVAFGRIGTDGQTKIKQCNDAAMASAAADKLVAEKVHTGYTQVGGRKGATPVAAKAGKPAADKPARRVPDEFGNRAPAPFPPFATGDANLDKLLDELTALKYGDRTAKRRDALTKAIVARFRKRRAGDPEVLISLLSEDACDLGVVQPTDELPGTPAVKRARSLSWNTAWALSFARELTLTMLLQAALQYPACDQRIADIFGKSPLEHCKLVADAVYDTEEKLVIGPKLLGAFAKRVSRTGKSSKEGIAHEAVVKALMRAPVEEAFETLAPLVRAWQAAGQGTIETLAQDVDEMQNIALDPRWRGVLHELIRKNKPGAIPVLQKLPPDRGDVPVLLKSIERDLAKIKPGHEGEPSVDQDVLVMLAESGDKRALPALLKVTECTDFDWALRDVLFEAIAEIGDPSALEPLARFVARNEEDGDERLVKAARAAIKKLAKASGKSAPSVAPTAAKSKAGAKAKPAAKPRPYGAAGQALAVPKTTAAQERANIEALIDKADLPAEVAARVKSALRAAIRIYTKRVADDSLPVGTSHFGGRPDLAPGTPWPHARKIPMTFLAQFRCEELAPFDIEGKLPKHGLFAVFLHDELPDGVDEPEMYTAHEVLFFADAKRLERAALPEGFDLGAGRTPLATAAVRFHTSFELPTSGTRDAKALGKEAESLELPESLDLPRPDTLNQLLGYDDYRGYDDAPPKGTRPLFRCESDDQASMNFGDAQDIAFRIKDDDLAAARFERVKLWFQAG